MNGIKKYKKISYVVTKSVDAFVHYITTVEAPSNASQEELVELAKQVNDSDWQEHSVTEYDDVNYEAIPPRKLNE